MPACHRSAATVRLLASGRGGTGGIRLLARRQPVTTADRRSSGHPRHTVNFRCLYRLRAVSHGHV